MPNCSHGCASIFNPVAQGAHRFAIYCRNFPRAPRLARSPLRRQRTHYEELPVIRRARLSVLIAVCVAANAAAARLNIDLPGTSIPVEVATGYAHATLTLSGPD